MKQAAYIDICRKYRTVFIWWFDYISPIFYLTILYTQVWLSLFLLIPYHRTELGHQQVQYSADHNLHMLFAELGAVPSAFTMRWWFNSPPLNQSLTRVWYLRYSPIQSTVLSHEIIYLNNVGPWNMLFTQKLAHSSFLLFLTNNSSSLWISISVCPNIFSW